MMKKTNRPLMWVVALITAITSVGPFAPVQTQSACPLNTRSAYKSPTHPGVFFVTNDCTKRPFRNRQKYFSYFNSWNETTVISQSQLDSLPIDTLGFMPWGQNYDPKYGALAKIVTDPKVYLLLGTEKYWITSESVFSALGYKWDWIEDIDPALLDKYTTGSEINYTDRHPNYTIVKYASSPRVYQLRPNPNNSGRQVKVHVKNEVEFNRLRFRWDRIVTIPESEEYDDPDTEIDLDIPSSTDTPVVTMPDVPRIGGGTIGGGSGSGSSGSGSSGGGGGGGSSTNPPPVDTTPLLDPPQNPSDLVITAVSPDRIDISWTDNSDDEDGFRLQRSVEGGEYILIFTSDANVISYSDTGLDAETEYNYRITAFRASYNSDTISPASSVTTPPSEPPLAPTDLTATPASANRIDLTWTDNSNNESEFVIERSSDGVNFEEVGTAEPNATSYSNTGLDDATTYYYRVKARNSAGDSDETQISNATTESPPVLPSAPSGLTANGVSSGQIDLTWNDNSENEDEFLIERSDDDITFTQITNLSADITSYSDTGLDHASRYYYRLRARNEAGNTDYTQTVNASTFDIAPNSPSGLSASAVSTNEILVSWIDNSDNETGFIIERSEDNVNYIQAGTIGANITSVIDTGLSANTRYYYRVRAYNGIDVSDYTNGANAITDEPPVEPPDPPTAPSNLSLNVISSDQIDLDWTDNSDNEDGFTIERSTDGNTYAILANIASNQTSYADTGLQASTVYYYRVLAQNTGGSSGYTNTRNVTTEGQPSETDGYRVWPESYGSADVSVWKDDAIGAFSITIDDNQAPDHEWWQQQSNTYGWKFTWFVITERMGMSSFWGDWDSFRTLHNAGHAIESHTHSHLHGALTIDEEYSISKEQIEQNIPGAEVRSLAYPGGSNSGMNDEAVAANYYIAARNVVTRQNWLDGWTNYMSVNGIANTITIDAGNRVGLSNSIYYNPARTREFRSWHNMTYHQLDDVIKANITTAFDWIKERESDIWVGLFSDIAEYGRQRDNATVNVTSATSDEVRFTVADTLDNSIFNYPLTIKIRLDGSWASISAVQSGIDRTARIVTYDGGTYALVDAVPDAGTVIVSKTSGAVVETPFTPTSMNATALSPSSISLSWNDNSNNETGFRLERSINGTTFNQISSLSSNVSSYTDTGLNADTIYYYRIRAFNSAGNSSYSNADNARTHAVGVVPEEPTNLDADSVSDSQISLTWQDNSNNETGFRIVRQTGGADFTTIATVSPNITTYIDTGLNAGTVYYYRVQSYNDTGDSTFSAPSSAETDSDQQSGPLTASFEVLPGTTAEAGRELFLDASGSTDDESLYHGEFQWDFGDGYKMDGMEGGITVTHIYVQPGTYNVTLTVTDADGNQDSTTRTLTIIGDEMRLPPRPDINPLLELTFDNTLDDSSGNGLNAVWNNGTGNFVDGVEGAALDLTNGNDVRIDNTGILGGLDEITISLWFKKSHEDDIGYLIRKVDSSSGRAALEMRIRERYFGSRMNTTDAYGHAHTWTETLFTEDTAWHHYVAVYDGTNLHIYIDGMEIEDTTRAPAALTGYLVDSDDPLYIGSNSGSDVFSGYLDEVKIYDRALTPMELYSGFELWHADFHGHRSQYIYVKIPGELTADSTNRIRATVTNSNGYSETMSLNNRSDVLTLIDNGGGLSTLSADEKILINNYLIPGANTEYKLSVEITDSSGTVLDERHAYFDKTYDGEPYTSIDENNSIRVNGELFFPVTPTGINMSVINNETANYWQNWEGNGYINALHSQGFWPLDFTLNGWVDYLNASGNLGNIGPARWEGQGDYRTDRPYWRNADIENLEDYINTTKDHPNMLMWNWVSEPDLGNDAEYVPPEVVRAWTKRTQELDPQKLTTVTYSGHIFTRGVINYHVIRRRKYEYGYNANRFGQGIAHPYKGTHMGDFYEVDYYPIEWASPHSRGATMDLLASSLDIFYEETHNLVPLFSWVETVDINESDGGVRQPTPWHPTPEMLRMMTWLNVVHDAKGIGWFPYHSRTPEANFQEMAKFVDDIEVLTPAILAAPSERSINTTVTNNGRVDTMLREYNGQTYLFAVRISEVQGRANPDYASGDNLNEGDQQYGYPDPVQNYDVTATFDISGIGNATATLYDENGRTVSVNSGNFSDTFEPYDVHIYMID